MSGRLELRSGLGSALGVNGNGSIERLKRLMWVLWGEGLATLYSPKYREARRAAREFEKFIDLSRRERQEFIRVRSADVFSKYSPMPLTVFDVSLPKEGREEALRFLRRLGGYLLPPPYREGTVRVELRPDLSPSDIYELARRIRFRDPREAEAFIVKALAGLALIKAFNEWLQKVFGMKALRVRVRESDPEKPLEVFLGSLRAGELKEVPEESLPPHMRKSFTYFLRIKQRERKAWIRGEDESTPPNSPLLGSSYSALIYAEALYRDPDFQIFRNAVRKYLRRYLETKATRKTQEQPLPAPRKRKTVKHRARKRKIKI